MSFDSRPGAVLAASGSRIEHYGNPLSEQRALEGGGVVARHDLGVLELRGSDRLSWLDTLSSQSLQPATIPLATETLILDPHGHIEHAFHLLDDGTTCWLITDRLRLPAALDWLTRMRFRADVELRDASADWLVVAQVGALPAGVFTDAWPQWTDPWPGIASGGFGYAERTPPWSVTEWLVPLQDEAALVDDLQRQQIPIAGFQAFRAGQLWAGRPDISMVDDHALPHEFDWLRTAVHLNKGCYRGQETVAKVHNLGRPPRRLVRLQLDGSGSVFAGPGDTVWASKDGEPRQVGVVIDAALHWESGPIALALIKRAVPIDTLLTVQHNEDQIVASQEELVPVEAGPALSLPRMRRTGARP